MNGFSRLTVSNTLRWLHQRWLKQLADGFRTSWMDQCVTVKVWQRFIHAHLVPACTHTEALQTAEDSDSTNEDDNIQSTMTIPTTFTAAECSSRSTGWLLRSVVLWPTLMPYRHAHCESCTNRVSDLDAGCPVCSQIVRLSLCYKAYTLILSFRKENWCVCFPHVCPSSSRLLTWQ